jgi:hypothetical protein
MKILKSQPTKHRADERLAAAATLLARSCFIVSIQLNLLFELLVSSFVLAGFMRQRMNAAKLVRTQSIIHNITCRNKSSVNC